MAILTSVDGKVYEIPDDQLSRFELPEEVIAKVAAATQPETSPQDSDVDAAPAEPGEDDRAEPGADDPTAA